MKHLNPLYLLCFFVLIWCGFSNNFTWPNGVLGILISALLIYFMPIKSQQPLGRFCWLPFVNLVFYMIKALWVSSVQVIWDIVTPQQLSRPQMIEVPISVTHPIEIWLLANLISLTPGTLSLDYQADQQRLLVHGMFVDDADKMVQDIQHHIERRIQKVFRYD